MKKITKTSTNGLMNRMYAFLILLLICFPVLSQNVGINSTGAAPNADAGLDVNFTNKGVLIPRLALTNTASFLPLSAHVPGMIVYNTATAGDVKPGFYYDNGFNWVAGFPTGTATGNMIYWNGTAWMMIPAGLPGQYLQLNASNIPYWGGATGPLATLTTNAATLVTGISATTGANITADAGFAILTRGVCYGIASGPTTANSILVASPATGIGTFTSNLTGLSPVTTYYVRAYATNNAVTSYGNEVTFTTLPVLATLATTTAATSITPFTAVTGGNVTADGGAAVTERGICYSTTSNPTTANPKIVDTGVGTGSFVSSITGLVGSTTYYVRSYAINSVGTAYGAQISFITLTAPPTLTTVAITSIAGASAVSGGTMAWNGGGYSNYQNYGVCYSTTPVTILPAYIEVSSPNYLRIATNTTNGSVNPAVNITPWVTTLTGLSANTTYYIRSYLNIYKSSPSGWVTAYGPELSFTTSAPTAPVIASTNAVTAITGSTATSGGAITSDGGSAITTKGICWGVTPNPTLGVSNFTTASPATGPAAFSANITGLTGSTIYYVRAYATNAVGTTYGPVDVSFNTLPSSLYTLGQNIGYGIVGYIAPNGSGFIVSPNIATTAGWGCNNVNVPGIGTAIGTGKANTDIIITNCGTNTAAGVAKSYTGGGFNDWYLPSSLEWAQIATRFTFYGINSGNYYTSSQYGTNYTYATTYYNSGPSGTCYSSGALRVNGTFMGNGILAIRDFAAAPAVVPTVLSTTAISAVTATGGATGGYISSDGGGAITARGVCYGTSTAPTIAGTKTTNGTGMGGFTSTLTGLTTGTSYFIRAYATNSAGTAYGSEINFTPVAPGMPTVASAAVSNIGGTTATSGGNVVSDGGVAVTARGVCYGTTTAPDITGTKTTNGTGLGTFISNITGLTTGTLYYVRAYATNATGTSYGAESTFTPITTATLTTDAITNIAATTATSGGNITNNGGSAVTARGICWNTVIAPTIGDSKTTDGTGSGTFVSSITGLTVGLTYYVRAYATNGAGTSYGNEVTFVPSGPTIPTLTTATITNPTSTGGTFGGNITADGGSAITARGVCWNQLGSATIADSKTSDGTGTGTFVSNVTGLITGNGYWIRAYATNSSGTAYGQDEYYVPVGLPVPITGSLTYNTPDAFAQLPVYCTNWGGGTLSAYGVVWDVNPNPTINVANVNNVSGKTTESLSLYYTYQNALISPINPNGTVTYYIRTYATNEIGTNYGLDIIFTPGVAGLPTVQTDPVSTKVGALAEGGGTIISDGGSPILAAGSGLVWSLTADPTITANLGITTDGQPVGQFWSSMTGLTVGTTYHVRAYATNSIGTAYGLDVSFVATAAFVGQLVQGMNIWGNVFSIDGTGTHGIFANPNSYSVATDWGCSNTNVGTSTALGTGMANTTAIVNNIQTNACTSQLGAFAADYASWAFGPGYHLPSKDELSLMWTNRVAASLVFNMGATTNYWSSSEVDATNAWNINGTDGTWVSSPKTNLIDFFVVQSF